MNILILAHASHRPMSVSKLHRRPTVHETLSCAFHSSRTFDLLLFLIFLSWEEDFRVEAVLCDDIFVLSTTIYVHPRRYVAQRMKLGDMAPSMTFHNIIYQFLHINKITLSLPLIPKVINFASSIGIHY